MRQLKWYFEKYGWKYIFNSIKENWKDFYWWKKLINSHVLSPLIFRNNDGTYVFDEEWDNLIILDGCRFDFFEEEVKNWDIDGKLEYRVSRGSSTLTFLRENFEDDKFREHTKEIVYITANPYVSVTLEEKFFKIVPVWDFGWSEKFQTVLPDRVYEATLKAIRKYPKKRFIIHFMQPHQPFVKLGWVGDGTSRGRYLALSQKAKGSLHIWELFARGKISKEIMIWGYKENLKITFPYLEKLIRIMQGKIAITSDHGEAIGEKIHPLIPLRVYAHPHNTRIEPLIKVPWFISEGKADLNEMEKELIRLKTKRLKLADKKRREV